MDSIRSRLELRPRAFSTTASNESELGQLLRWWMFVEGKHMAELAAILGVSIPTAYSSLKTTGFTQKTLMLTWGAIEQAFGTKLLQTEIEELAATRYVPEVQGARLWHALRDRLIESRMRKEGWS